MPSVMSSGSPHEWDKWQMHHGRIAGQQRVVQVKRNVLSTQGRMELFSRVASLIRSPCACYDSREERCDRCFDLLQLFRLHRDLLGSEFIVLRRKEEERLAAETPNPKKQWSDGREL